MAKTNIKVRIIGANGNVYCALGICRRSLLHAGRLDLWDEFLKEATSGDYNKLLCTVSDWFDICFGDEDEDEYDEDED